MTSECDGLVAKAVGRSSAPESLNATTGATDDGTQIEEMSCHLPQMLVDDCIGALVVFGTGRLGAKALNRLGFCQGCPEGVQPIQRPHVLPV